MKLVASIVGLAILTGCATSGANYQPIIDIRPGQSQEQMFSDLQQCQMFAQRKASEAQAAVAGAIGSAVLGIAIGAALGGNSSINTKLGGASAIMGGVSAAGAASESRQAVVMRCMAGRGWNVLG